MSNFDNYDIKHHVSTKLNFVMHCRNSTKYMLIYVFNAVFMDIYIYIFMYMCAYTHIQLSNYLGSLAFITWFVNQFHDILSLFDC